MGKYKAIIFRSLYKEAMTEDITKECWYIDNSAPDYNCEDK